jgi:diphthamide biosynthesis methyltransferase
MHITVEEIIENEKEDLVTVILDVDEEAKLMLMEAGFNSLLKDAIKLFEKE